MTFHARHLSGLLLLSSALLGGCGGRDAEVTTRAIANEKQPDSAFVTSADVTDVSCAAPDGEGQCARTNGALCCPVLAYRYDPLGACWAPGGATHDTVACLESQSVGGTPDVCVGSGVYDCFERGEGTTHEILITTYTPGVGDTAMLSLGFTRCSTESRERVAVSGECPPAAP